MSHDTASVGFLLHDIRELAKNIKAHSGASPLKETDLPKELSELEGEKQTRAMAILEECRNRLKDVLEQWKAYREAEAAIIKHNQAISQKEARIGNLKSYENEEASTETPITNPWAGKRKSGGKETKKAKNKTKQDKGESRASEIERLSRSIENEYGNMTRAKKALETIGEFKNTAEQMLQTIIERISKELHVLIPAKTVQIPQTVKTEPMNPQSIRKPSGNRYAFVGHKKGPEEKQNHARMKIIHQTPASSIPHPTESAGEKGEGMDPYLMLLGKADELRQQHITPYIKEKGEAAALRTRLWKKLNIFQTLDNYYASKQGTHFLASLRKEIDMAIRKLHHEPALAREHTMTFTVLATLYPAVYVAEMEGGKESNEAKQELPQWLLGKKGRLTTAEVGKFLSLLRDLDEKYIPRSPSIHPEASADQISDDELREYLAETSLLCTQHRARLMQFWLLALRSEGEEGKTNLHNAAAAAEGAELDCMGSLLPFVSSKQEEAVRGLDTIQRRYRLIKNLKTAVTMMRDTQLPISVRNGFGYHAHAIIGLLSPGLEATGSTNDPELGTYLEARYNQYAETMPWSNTSVIS